MANEASMLERTAVTVRLHPTLIAFLEARQRKSGMSIDAEIQLLVGTAMEAAEVPVAPADARFTCSEELMAQKAECSDCSELVRSNAKSWAERHVQLTGHRVEVSLYYDLRDDDWLENLTPERRVELDDLRENPESVRAVAEQILRGLKGQKPH